MFGWLINLVKRWNAVPPLPSVAVEPQQEEVSPLEPVQAEPSPVLPDAPEKEPEELERDDLPLEDRYFLHTKMRVLERYQFPLTRKMYDEWCRLISIEGIGTTFIMERGSGDGLLYMVSYGPRDVFCVFSKGLVVTVLEPKPHWVKQATSNRSARKPRRHSGKVKATQVGRGNLDPKPVKKEKAAPLPAPIPAIVDGQTTFTPVDTSKMPKKAGRGSKGVGVDLDALFKK